MNNIQKKRPLNGKNVKATAAVVEESKAKILAKKQQEEEEEQSSSFEEEEEEENSIEQDEDEDEEEDSIEEDEEEQDSESDSDEDDEMKNALQPTKKKVKINNQTSSQVINNNNNNKKDNVKNEGEEEENNESSNNTKKASAAAWMDDDDENTVLQKKALSKMPKWAKKSKPVVDGEEEDEEDLEDYNHDAVEEKVFQNVTKLITDKANIDYSVLAVKTFKVFHESKKVIAIDNNNEFNITCVASQTNLHIYRQGTLKRAICSFTYPQGFKANFVSFIPNTNNILIVGTYGHYYLFNPETKDLKQINLRIGKNTLKSVAVSFNYYAIEDSLGKISLISNTSNTVVNNIQLSKGNVSAIKFSPDGNTLYVASEGSVSCFNIKTMRISHRFKDLGNVSTQSITSICCSPNGNYLATGSESGIVNIYDIKSSMTSETPTPLKSISSIIYPITDLAYDPTSKYLCAVSELQKEIVRVIQHPSLNVVSMVKVPKVGQLTKCSFDHQGYLVFGNARGTIYQHTAKLHHKSI
ncbi:WD40 repeat-containing protein [Cavenderia fasciculata]|uniref:WD40 repeat-containing protein n=1 Tax=Cavenderia fasciculata TaxID=261658 RepID=F4Q5M7_CACFS|nr:WD40 repeat-containing protein [Cavenderia fasciculata]EGG17286.1 WD40 repeat-containing protein [Cavenderia fasciculata]|eukprot:XP_004355770.1 WD40 repeat-containing protein [Cavenderia fasciculata]